MVKKSYSADDITVLEGLEAVRRRPGMYIGTTGPDGLHHLINEIFDNSRDEAMAHHADQIEIVLLPNNTVRISDNGRGIPVDIHKKTKVSALETIMTTLHAGGKFGGDGYKVSGGLHGVGAAVVNALSTDMKVVVHRDGETHQQEYKIGKPIEKVKKIGNTKASGTIVYFTPDEGTFGKIHFVYDRIVEYLRFQAYLVKGLKIKIIDARELNLKSFDDTSLFIDEFIPYEAQSKVFLFDGGLKSFVAYTNQDMSLIHKTIFHAEKTIGEVEVEIAVQYVDDISNRIIAFANNIMNPEGGTHITGFKTALTRSINNYAKENKLQKEKDEAFTGEDVLEGISAIVLVRIPEIQFEGQTKAKLGTVEARGAVDAVFSEAFKSFLEENPDEAKSIIAKSTLAMKARKAAKVAKDSVFKKGLLDNTLSGKLTNCQTKDPDEAELLIVEGESAGGTARSGRDRKIQAILSLKGKPLNAEKSRLDKLLLNEEIKTMAIAFGVGIGDTLEIDKLKYKKVIIATDADVDGAHIRTLLITLFYRYFKPLIDNGNVYIAQPPLYKIKKGKDVKYAYTESEKESIVKNADLSEDAIQRYKGLGEMNADELWETTLNPEQRILKQITVADGVKANKIFDTLMGVDVQQRKLFIQKNAKTANVDI